MSDAEIFFDNIYRNFQNDKIELEVLKQFHDKEYRNFISHTNGGFFFSKAFHIYGICENNNFHSIVKVNALINSTYKDLIEEQVFFGCDIFGNQFSFSKR